MERWGGLQSPGLTRRSRVNTIFNEAFSEGVCDSGIEDEWRLFRGCA